MIPNRVVFLLTNIKVNLINVILLQKDSINFALYDSNWTEMNIEFKKLLLHTMRMNNAYNFKLKATTKQIVNLELFTNVNIFFKILKFGFTLYISDKILNNCILKIN